MVEPKPTVSDWDREYFRRIGEFERQNAEDELRRHLARSLGERLRVSLEISRQWSKHLKHNSREDDDPGAFYERARELGLYRSKAGTKHGD